MRLLIVPALVSVLAGPLAAQEPLKVGDPAPDFSLPAATRDGIPPQSVRLSGLRDQTVVIAFFYKARTKG